MKSKNNKITLIIFSYNRANQLHFLLKSVIREIKHISYPIHIIHKYSPEHDKSYRILKKNWKELTESFLQNHYDPSYSSNTIKNDRKIIKLINAKTLSHSEISKIAKKILKNN